MSVQIFYFSGTGNSLHAAKEIKKRMNGAELTPIVGFLRNGGLKSSGDVIGIVFPIYAFTMPMIVKKFLKKTDLSSASYLFVLTTRFCSPRVFTKIDKILRKKGKTLGAGFSVQMPENYIPVFEAPPEEEILKSESDLQSKLDEVRRIIMDGNKHFDNKEIPLIWMIVTRILFPVLTFLFHSTRYFNLEKKFYAGPECSGCGTCEKVCLSGKISLAGNKPVWRKEVSCLFCLACIHYCPPRAIQIRKTKTVLRGRYHHPEITADDIAGQRQLIG